MKLENFEYIDGKRTSHLKKEVEDKLFAKAKAKRFIGIIEILSDIGFEFDKDFYFGEADKRRRVGFTWEIQHKYWWNDTEYKLAYIRAQKASIEQLKSDYLRVPNTQIKGTKYYTCFKDGKFNGYIFNVSTESARGGIFDDADKIDMVFFDEINEQAFTTKMEHNLTNILASLFGRPEKIKKPFSVIAVGNKDIGANDFPTRNGLKMFYEDDGHINIDLIQVGDNQWKFHIVFPAKMFEYMDTSYLTNLLMENEKSYLEGRYYDDIDKRLVPYNPSEMSNRVFYCFVTFNSATNERKKFNAGYTYIFGIIIGFTEDKEPIFIFTNGHRFWESHSEGVIKYNSDERNKKWDFSDMKSFHIIYADIESSTMSNARFNKYSLKSFCEELLLATQTNRFFYTNNEIRDMLIGLTTGSYSGEYLTSL